jgi:DUF4097 and DUF4098 domain-containing protein YvlB
MMNRALLRPVFRVVAGFVAAASLAYTAEAQRTGQRRDGAQRIDTTFAFNRNGEFRISVGGGEIRVTAWARSDVRVIAVGERGVISMETSPNSARIQVRPAGTSRARFEIRVPIGVRVLATTVGADVDVSGTQAELSLSTVTGRITASDGNGRSHIETAAGSVALQRFSGETRVGSMTGPITIDEIGGDLFLTTITAPTVIERADLTNLTVEAAQGNIDFSGRLSARGRHRIETFGGNIELRLPADLGATIDMESLNGKVHAVDFPVTMRARPATARGRESDRQEYTINGGGARISISTLNGGVFLRKLAAANRR